MKSKLIIGLLLLGLTAFGQQSLTFSYSGPPLMVFTDDANIATIANIPVDRYFTVQGVTVSVNVAYTPVGDLNVYMYGPDGTRTKLVERSCGSQGNLFNISFDDTATTPYDTFCPAEPNRGPFRPKEPLANFNGKNSAGIWRLAVENNGSDHIGYLNGWSVTLRGSNIVTPGISGVVNRSSLKTGAIAPNSSILVYGVNLGPQTPEFAPANQTLPMSLGGVEVLWNGNPIPLRGVSAVAIDALVPPDVVPGTAGNVQVRYGGTLSNSIGLNVQPTVPGLYSQGVIGGSDLGSWSIVKANDQDYRVITSNNRAKKGSVITIYASGLGVTNPVLPAGQIPPNSPLYLTTNETFASIGGIAAPVLYSGLAPGYPGVYQLNLQVPANVGSGLQNIIIWNGGGVSQDFLSLPIE